MLAGPDVRRLHWGAAQGTPRERKGRRGVRAGKLLVPSRGRKETQHESEQGSRGKVPKGTSLLFPT